MLTTQTCELFEMPFFQFAQLKKFCPEQIPQIKADYKREWNQWKACILQVADNLGAPFCKPHIESWTNGWQVRAHFFAYFKYEFNQNSAAIFSVLLNRRRLRVCLDWHCYRADRSQIQLAQYNQWLEHLDCEKFADWEIWRADESEYDDFRQVKNLSRQELTLHNNEDYWCIGRNVEKAAFAQMDCVEFITQTILDLSPLYEKCHQ